jgi:1,4-alpha-glucan branching enzyme
VRAFLPEAEAAWVVAGKRELPMERVPESDFFECRVKPPHGWPFIYQIKMDSKWEGTTTFFDPYCFDRVLTDYDLYLIGEGTHYQKYEKMGAHIIEFEGVHGVHFAVWAPNARGVSVIGDFNGWDGRRHPMRLLGGTGVWELFIPGLDEGTLYKFEIKSEAEIFVKADPYGFYAEVRPQTASVVWDLGAHEWEDGEWMEDRRNRDWLHEPISVYEVHLGSWMRDADGAFVGYRDLAHRLVDYVLKMGYTHIELLPVTEHPLDASWGYQTIGYFSVTSRFGAPEDFMYFVDHCHRNGIGVLLDWVPAHFPKDAHGLAHFDGTFLYEHAHPFQREHRDWGTLIFNYGRKEVASFLLNSALFWLDKYHIDGLRVDAVASMLYLNYSREDGEWIPNKYGGNENLEAIAFIKRFNELCHEYFPGVLTVAEESTAWPMVSRPTYAGGLGFSLKWNMGWMHDMLGYMSQDPVFRKYHQNALTFGLIYAFHENFVLVLSHDEVVHGKAALMAKMPGDLWQQFANARLLHGYMYAHPGKKMLFMGGEFGQWNEWYEGGTLSWDLLQYEPHQRLQRFIQDLNRLYRTETALHRLDFEPAGFEWIDFSDADNSVISFIRRAEDPADHLLFVFNFTPVPRENYRVGVPEHAIYREVLNSDSNLYWGSNVGNAGVTVAEAHRVNQWEHSINVTLPPLGMLVFKPHHD